VAVQKAAKGLAGEPRGVSRNGRGKTTCPAVDGARHAAVAAAGAHGFREADELRLNLDMHA